MDHWCLTAGDSLIDKIGEGLETSDRPIVFFSPDAFDSNWVKKEVAIGLILELVQETGLGAKFVIPALLKPCKIPILLRDFKPILSPFIPFFSTTQPNLSSSSLNLFQSQTSQL